MDRNFDDYLVFQQKARDIKNYEKHFTLIPFRCMAMIIAFFRDYTGINYYFKGLTCE